LFASELVCGANNSAGQFGMVIGDFRFHAFRYCLHIVEAF